MNLAQEKTVNLEVRGSFPKDMAMIQFQIEFLDSEFQPVDIWNASANLEVRTPIPIPFCDQPQYICNYYP